MRWRGYSYLIVLGNAAVSFRKPTKERGPATVDGALVGMLVMFWKAAGVESMLAL